MFEYMTAQEAAELWGISVRRVQRLCKENRIEGVLNINRISCLFPAGAFLFCCVPACLQFGGIRQKKSVLHPLMKFIIKSTWINFTVLWTRKTVTE